MSVTSASNVIEERAASEECSPTRVASHDAWKLDAGYALALGENVGSIVQSELGEGPEEAVLVEPVADLGASLGIVICEPA